MRIAWLLLLAGCVGAPTAAVDEELVLCGRDEVFIVDAAGRKTWSWRAKDRPELPEALRGRFNSTDECKPVEGGAKILITSSGGGVALVERATGRAVFWAQVTNAHSAELLPGGRVVVAGSYGEGGNRLVLFDLATPGKETGSHELYGAHGAVWDAARGLLWALGHHELRACRLGDALSPVAAFPLPDPSGHDLRAEPSGAGLIVTTGKRAWRFDRDRRAFEAFGAIAEAVGVKSVDVHPRSGRLVYVQAETSYWSERVRFLDPAGEMRLPGERLYKARWLASR